MNEKNEHKERQEYSKCFHKYQRNGRNKFTTRALRNIKQYNRTKNPLNIHFNDS